jgi:hypothetical protein
MNSSALIASHAELRYRLAGWGAAFIAVALAGVPYLVWGEITLYTVLIPAVAGAVAFALYYVNRPLYFGFALWVWFLTPFVRRLIDYASGAYIESNPVMTTPYIVSGVGVLGLWAVLTEDVKGVRQAYSFVIVALIYGAMIGLVINGAVAMATAVLEWGLPVVMSALLLADWQRYPEYRKVALRTITVAMGVIGLYGLYQFFVLPPWDKLWMESVDMNTIGYPAPLQVRVFGTLNSPFPFAMTLAVGLLGLFAVRGQGLVWGMLAWLAAVPATVSLLLTETRTAWGAIFVGFFFILLRAHAKSRRAIAFYLAAAAVVAVPLLLYEPISMEVTSRFSTFGDIQEDESFQDRVARYEAAAPLILTTPTGIGLGSFGSAARVSGGGAGTQDSGILTTLFSLGWIGALLYGLGVGILFLWVWRAARGDPGGDRFLVVASGMAVAVLSAIPFGDVFSGVAGMYLWGFLALALAGARYYYTPGAGMLERPALPGLARPRP